MINSDVSKATKSASPFSEPVYEKQYGEFGEELFRAGQVVEAGSYTEVDGFRQVTLEIPGPLPASLDGRRALYRRYERPWVLLQATAKVATNN